jgi:drug/metabolite transporter (DMT)-like permease
MAPADRPGWIEQHMGTTTDRLQKIRGKRLAYVAVIAAVVVMGSLGVIVHKVSTDPVIIAFARLSLGFVFLAGLLAVSRNFQALKFSMSPSLIASGLAIGLSVWSYTEAIAHTSLAEAAFLLYLGPLLAVGFSYLFLKEKLAFRSVLLIGLAFLGCLFMLQFDLSFPKAEFLGPVYGLLSAVGYALFIVSNRRISAEVPALGRAFYQLLVATLIVTPFLAGKAIAAFWHDLPWLIAAGFFQGFMALTLVIFAIRHLTAYEYGLLSYLEPVTATLVGVTIYAEPLTPLQALGGILIVLSGIAQILEGQTDRMRTDTAT